MAEYEGASQFHKAGLQRLRDAEQLLQPPTIAPNQSDANSRHLRAAMYLAGYSIECALKEYIIAHTPPAKSISEALIIRQAKGLDTININSAAGHNLDALLSLTDLEKYIIVDPKVSNDWLICLKWKSTWRYDPVPPARAIAQGFVGATRNIYLWIQQRI